jgi:hypothetical protein
MFYFGARTLKNVVVLLSSSMRDEASPLGHDGSSLKRCLGYNFFGNFEKSGGAQSSTRLLPFCANERVPMVMNW